MQVKVKTTGKIIEVIPKAIDMGYKFVDIITEDAYEFDELEPVRIRTGGLSQTTESIGVRVGVTVTGKIT